MQSMRYARSNHGVVVLGNKIYVAGGDSYYQKSVKQCERFDLRREVWSDIPSSDFDMFGIGVVLMAVKSRYAIAMGG